MGFIIEIIYSLILVLFLLYIFPRVKKETGVKGFLILYISSILCFGAYITITSLLWGGEFVRVQHLLICVTAVILIFFLITVLFKSPPEVLSKEIKGDLFNKNCLNEDYVPLLIKDENTQEKQIKLPVEKNYSINEKLLYLIYREFIKRNLLMNKISEKEFVERFLKNPIQLKLDAISLYYFHKRFKSDVLNISLKEFVTYFKNEEGKLFDYNTVKNGSNTKTPKQYKLIDAIFGKYDY